MRLLLFLLFYGCLVTSEAQEKYKILPANADCSAVIDLILPADTLWGPTNAPSGSGKVMELSGDKNSLYTFEKEHNTVWYRFRIPEDGTMTLDIIPVNDKDDYDFILFKYSGKQFCRDVSEKTIKPVRACISRNDPATGSRTGLSFTASDEYIHSGPGLSYCKAIGIKKGEVYVLVLDNVYPGGDGHTLRLHYYRSSKGVQQNQNRQENNPVQEQTTLSVTITDKETHELVKGTARIFVKQKKQGAPLSAFDSITSFNTSLKANSLLLLKIEAKGYFDYSREIKTLGQAENINIKAELDKIIVGKNVIFDNILFYGDEARFLPESDPALENLSGTLRKNPRMKIEIQGHVNCPTTWDECLKKSMQEYNMSLSIRRAKAVYEYLKEEGIAGERMTYNGYGAMRMIYPDARSEEKMRLNRRVEIKIISN